MKNKCKSENTGHPHVKVRREVLLLSSFDSLVEELKEYRLQQAEEVREEKRQQKVDLKEQHILPVYHATKLLIKKYSNTEKELIPLALKVFPDETKAHMFLSLEGEWNEQWLVSVCEEVRKGKN